MLTQRRAREQRSNVTCIVVTPEAAPLLMFGSAASGAVAELLRTRGIEFEAASSAHETTTGEITLVPGQRELNADIVVALPQLHPAHIAGLTSGFIPIDAHARVPGLDGVYAAGDATMFPIKQGGLGTQQADAAVEHIAALVGAEIDPKPFHPILRGKLLTGDETISLRHDVTGGTGEGQASPDYLWWPPHKVAGRYFAAWLGHSEPCDPEPPAQGSLEVEISLPQEWHEQPMALDPYGKL